MLEKQQGLSLIQPACVPTGLTHRQRNVLLYIARGLTDQATATELNVSLDTIRYYKKKLYQKMDADNAITAVIRALKDGFLSLNEI